jgi:hypothetical protein
LPVYVHLSNNLKEKADMSVLVRYALIPEKKGECVLVTTHIPISRAGKPQPCYLTKWGDPKYAPQKIVSTGTEATSALAVRYVPILL